ncbi:efflux RND transporter periplasmic adaptor subunit [Marichromatium sp. AB31]|uniref:efflux RND transporter periplasmic adaptor subunit n=1 Tax=Marichromatium sp. AB31 TaxID=2483362 RepID=UPI000F417195|nr:efflux RND transporter periplasmic adaptor subunit [Marichromatium sp. AB31]RNE89045.1 efflux RND transporter periplasmic adaptor subunit [Marichromatium sp. AB31]
MTIMRKRTAAGLTGLAALTALALPLYGDWSSEATASQPTATEVTRPVPTAVVTRDTPWVTRDFPGSVRANRRVELAFDLDGLLVELDAREGQAVAAGTVLARLDDRDARNALSAAQARFDDAHRTLDRARELRGQRMVSESEYDKARAALDIARAELQAREKAVTDTVLRAPFDGVVAARHLENHERVTAGQTVLSLQDGSRIEVVIQVPERLIAQGGLEALRNPRVRFDVEGQRWFAARTHEYRLQPDQATRTYDLTIALAPPPGINILPGMNATVRTDIDQPPVATGAPTEVITRVPSEAVWRDADGGCHVWVVPEAGGTPRRVRVEPGPLRDGQMLILSGLRPGQRVAVAGLRALREDLPVRPRLAGKRGLEG